jgi:hypothetical protein
VRRTKRARPGISFVTVISNRWKINSTAVCRSFQRTS